MRSVVSVRAYLRHACHAEIDTVLRCDKLFQRALNVLSLPHGAKKNNKTVEKEKLKNKKRICSEVAETVRKVRVVNVLQMFSFEL